MLELEIRRTVLEEIPLRVCGVYAPPVVCEHVEYAQNDDEEDSRPFGLEANGYHAAGSETEERDEYSCNAPSTLEDKAEEQEDEENATSKQEATT